MWGLRWGCLTAQASYCDHIMFMLLVGIWNSGDLNGVAMKSNSERGVRNGRGVGVVSRREALHASSADTFPPPVHFLGGRGERSRLTCNCAGASSGSSPFLVSPKPSPATLAGEGPEGSCKEVLNRGAARDLAFGLLRFLAFCITANAAGAASSLERSFGCKYIGSARIFLPSRRQPVAWQSSRGLVRGLQSTAFSVTVL